MVEDIVVGRDRKDLAELGNKGTAFIGKHVVGKGEEAHLTNPIKMDLTRPHILLVCGKRGCLTGDNMVFTDKGYKPIKDFVKTDRVLSFNIKNLGLEWKNANLLTYPTKNNEKLIKFRLRDGREIVATEEHPLLVYHKNVVLLWKNAKDIKEGESLITVTKLPETEIKNDKESLRIARLLGFVLADGTMNITKGTWKDGRGYWYNGYRRRLRIFNASEEVLETAKNDIEKEFSVKAKRYKRNDCNCDVVESQQRKVVEKLMELGVPLGKKSDIIHIPKIVWESSNAFKMNFLKAIFSCDGYVEKNGSRIEYYTNSKKFIKELQILLAHFNIESNVNAKKAKIKNGIKISYRLGITDFNSMMNYKEKIGFFSEDKRNRLEKRKFFNAKRRKGTVYIEDNIVCSKIVKKETVKGIKNVYDLTVPENNSFIANGIISHNSGKSYSAGVVAEELTLLDKEIKQNLSVLMIDTMGIYWSMKRGNEKERTALHDWGLEPKPMEMKFFIPKGYVQEYKDAGVEYDYPFTLPCGEMTAVDWIITFGFKPLDDNGILVERAVKAVKKRFGGVYSIDDIISQVNSDPKAEKKIKDAVSSRFEAAKEWGIFEKVGTPVERFFAPGAISVIDISHYARSGSGWSVRSMVIGLFAKKIFQARLMARKSEELEVITGEKKRSIPMVWVIIDEAHQFIPAEGTTAAFEPIQTLIKEGREPGISLLLITQIPNKLHPDALAQSDMVIAHRLTSEADMKALQGIMQTYMLDDIMTQINNLPRQKGVAIMLDDNSERIYSMQIRPRMSWHAGGSPRAIKKKSIFEE